MRYAVRCCCKPTKVLGWIDGPADCTAFSVAEPVVWSLAVAWSASPASPAALAVPPVHRIKVREFVHADHTVERAVYSDDRPLAFWLKLPGFQPAKVRA